MLIQKGDWCLRSYRETDAPSLAKYANNPRISATMSDGFPYPYTLDHAQNWLRNVQKMPHETFFAIAFKQEVVGGIGFSLRTDVYRKSAEIAYWLAEPFWGQGIITWAVQAISQYAFENFDLVRLQAAIYEINPASVRVLEKAGYQLEGRLRKSVYKNGKLIDSLLYAKIKEDA